MNDDLLRYDLKGVNNTTNIDAVVPSLLAFSVLSSFPMKSKASPSQDARSQAVVNALLEMVNTVREQRIARAIKSKLPPAIKYDINWFTAENTSFGLTLSGLSCR